MPKLTKRWQDENQTTWLERLGWFLLILAGCLYITHGHEIINNYLIDIIG
jgi:hypothetical protein